MDLIWVIHVLGLPEHDIIISGKGLSAYVSMCLSLQGQHFVASITQTQMHQISWIL